LVFLTAVIAAGDDYQDILRASVASAVNDHRLGANEAPPAIISIFLGDELDGVVQAIIKGERYSGAGEVDMDLGVAILPNLRKDNTDRNRTSPFAFTGNKFEFRMPGSQMNLADCNTVLNTAVAHELKDYVNAVSGCAKKDFEKMSLAYIRDVLVSHQRIIFNGDGYSDDWPAEAAKRGLLNLHSTVDAVPTFLEGKNIKLFEEFGVLNHVELESRVEVKLEQYSKLLRIEGLTMSHMAKRKIFPAVNRYAGEVSKTIVDTKTALPSADTSGDEKLLADLTQGLNDMSVKLAVLDEALAYAEGIEDTLENARAYQSKVLAAMEDLRVTCDHLEDISSTECWPIPTYNKMLFYV
ncbi:MAG: glutamine synthetase type III, partial [Coriobacteriales bacterium]